MPTVESQSEQTESKIEMIKRSSNGLRGNLIEELDNGHPSFSKESEQILKFHGIYDQDNRDVRSDRKRRGLEVEHICMIRLAIPGGRLLPEQYLAIDHLADLLGNTTLRVTSRQGIQFHFVTKKNLKKLIQMVNEVLITTYAGCGDVVRNVTACPSTSPEIEALALGQLADELSQRYKPASTSYYEIWIDSEKMDLDSGKSPNGYADPVYGDAYLPRKFKIGITSTTDNCIDALSCDLALAIDPADPGVVKVLIGGGLGRSHSDETTKPMLARPLAQLPRENLFKVTDAIIAIQRDHGNRADRSHARFKYLVEEWGIARMRNEVERRVGFDLAPFDQLSFPTSCDHLGWQLQNHQTFSYGIKLPSGRIADTQNAKYRTAIRDLVKRYGLCVRFSAKEDILLTGIPSSAKEDLIATLRANSVTLPEKLSGINRSAFACPALPTCGLALAESERFLPSFLDAFKRLCEDLKLANLDVEIRMTGCPNGCARPYLGEIGIVGRSKRSYDIYLGADRAGSRLGELYAADVFAEALADALEPVVLLYSKHSKDGERFGDFCHRWRISNLRDLAPEPRRRAIQISFKD